MTAQYLYQALTGIKPDIPIRHSLFFKCAIGNEVIDMKPSQPAWRQSLLVLLIVFSSMSLTACKKDDAKLNRARDCIEVSEDGRYIKPIFREVSVRRDIPYGKAVDYKGDKETLLLDIYTPEGDTETNRPAIIWVHGGGLMSGSKEAGIQNPLTENFAKKGYVCISINYRLRENMDSDFTVALTNAVTDAYTAMQWVIAHSEEYGIDPTHIAFGGHSAGGHIVTGLCYHDQIKLSGDTDAIFCIINMSGGYFGLGQISPDAPPCIVINGDRDTMVPCSDAEQCVKYLEEAGIDVTFHALEGCGHELDSRAAEVEDVITKYLYQALTGIEPDVPIRKGS